MYTDRQKAEALRLLSEVNNNRRVSERTGVPRSTLNQWRIRYQADETFARRSAISTFRCASFTGEVISPEDETQEGSSLEYPCGSSAGRGQPRERPNVLFRPGTMLLHLPEAV